MNKMIVAATATLIAATALMAAPANAGSVSFSLGIGGFGPAYGYGPGYYGGGVYVAPPVYVQPQPVGNWQMHVNWCASHYASYNPNTNMYVKKIVNNQPVFKTCNSPYV